MANTVFKLRRSSVAGKQPNTSTLAIGELALNLTDRKLYSSDGTNVWETGANLTNLSVSANATVNNLVITGGLFANGNDGSVGQVLTSNGTGVYWATSSGGGGGILDVRQQYTGDGVTNTFTVDGGYNSNSLSVYLNGVLLHNGTEANVINGETFSLSIPPANGALIDVIGISALYANGITTTVSQQFTANGTANSFTITGGYLPNKIQVFLNGVKQVPGTDVILTSGSTVNFTTTPANNYIVDVFGHQSDIIAHMYANQDLQYTWTNTHNFTNTVTLTSVSANGGYGTAGQALTTNGSSVYWSTIVGTNTAAQYVWTNTHTFNANVNVNAALIANGTAGIDSQVLTTNGSGIYWSSAGVNTAAQYIWSNTQTFSNTITFSSVINGTANAANYLGGNSALDLRNYSDTKAGTAYTNAVSYTDTKIGTANSAITANASAAYTNAVAYVDGKSYVNTSQLTNNLSNYALLSGATFTGNVVANNANTTYDLNVGRNLTVAGNLTITGNVTVIGANNLSIVDNFIYLNSNNTTQNIDVGFAANYNDGTYHHTGFFRDATDGIYKVFDNYGPEPDANVNIDTTNTTFHVADFQANTLYGGNTSTNWFIANTGGTYVTGTVNASSLTVGSKIIANTSRFVIDSTVALSANGNVGINGQILTSNGSTVYWSSPASMFLSQSFTGDGTTTQFAVSGGYIANQLEVFVNGVKISSTTANVSSGANVVFTSPPANNSQIEVLGYVPINYTYANTSAQYVWTNTQTFSNLVMISSAGISANGSYGTNGQVLTSNGTSVFWSNSATYVRQTFTGTGACTTFQVTGGYTPNNLDVYVTGVKQLSPTDVDISSGNNIVFTIAPTNTAPIEVVGVIPLLYSYANQTYSYTWTNTHTFSNGTASATVNASIISIGNSSVNTQIVAGNVFLNGSTLVIGNTASNITINSTAISVGTVQLNTTSYAGTANNTSFVGSVSAANVVSNAQLSANLGNYAALAGATFTGDVVMNGNLTVSGTTVSVNVATLDVKDKNITVAKGSTASGSDGAGITVDGSNIGWYYTYSSNTWTSNVGIIPASNVSYNLGSATLNWSNVYANNILSAGAVNAASHTVGTNFTANTTSISIANTLAQTNITPTSIFLGNSTVNCVINSTSVYVNGVDYNPTTALAIAVALS